jgi:hypothetical protein
MCKGSLHILKAIEKVWQEGSNGMLTVHPEIRATTVTIPDYFLKISNGHRGSAVVPDEGRTH